MSAAASVHRRSQGVVLGCLVALLVGACSTLPTSGDVHTRPASVEESANQAPYFAPPGPTASDDPEGIVRGFLLAMQANPPSTAVARSFLSERARAVWRPNQGTIVYDAVTVDNPGPVGKVSVRLSGAHRLSPQGAWLDGTDGSSTTIPVSLVRDSGQWRIENPPDALVVPASYFSSLFVPFNLYFFDRTGTVLVPSKVYVPRGDQTATNLVRGLLAGPPPGLRGVAVSAFPSRADLDDLAVVVNDAGIADVPLGPTLLELSPAGLNRVVVELAWTLRQVPGINRLRLTVDGAPVPLSGGSTDVSVARGADYDPVVPAERDLLVLTGGRVVRDDGDQGTAVGGPFGASGYALRSIAWDARGHRIAGVAQNGRRVLVAPDRGSRSGDLVRSVFDGGSDLLRPSYDRFGKLWLVDTPRNARVHLVGGNRSREIEVPGVSGRDVAAFTVTNDGARLVAVLAGGTNPVLQVSNIVRDVRGRVLRVRAVRTLQVTGADLGAPLDVGQEDTTLVAVLSRPDSGPDRLVFVELDGSTGPVDPQLSPDAPDVVPAGVETLVASPDPVLALRGLGRDGSMFTLTDSRRWVRAKVIGVVAATYAR